MKEEMGMAQIEIVAGRLRGEGILPVPIAGRGVVLTMLVVVLVLIIG